MLSVFCVLLFTGLYTHAEWTPCLNITITLHYIKLHLYVRSETLQACAQNILAENCKFIAVLIIRTHPSLFTLLDIYSILSYL